MLCVGRKGFGINDKDEGDNEDADEDEDEDGPRTHPGIVRRSKHQHSAVLAMGKKNSASS